MTGVGEWSVWAGLEWWRGILDSSAALGKTGMEAGFIGMPKGRNSERAG